MCGIFGVVRSGIDWICATVDNGAGIVRDAAVLGRFVGNGGARVYGLQWRDLQLLGTGD